MSNDANIFSYINQLVHPYNSFKEINSRYNKLTKRVDIKIQKKYSKEDIEKISGKKVNAIIESESERPEVTDLMIDYEFEPFDIHTIFYLKDMADRYYITEV